MSHNAEAASVRPLTISASSLLFARPPHPTLGSGDASAFCRPRPARSLFKHWPVEHPVGSLPPLPAARPSLTFKSSLSLSLLRRPKGDEIGIAEPATVRRPPPAARRQPSESTHRTSAHPVPPFRASPKRASDVLLPSQVP